MTNIPLQRKLGLWACISIVAGSVIGSSIFMKPSTMAAQIGSPELLFLVWIVAGIISIFGGMINAEIGAMLPVSGGQYAWFRMMYGDFFAYLYGWASMIVINTASIAAICFIASQYCGYFIELPHFSENIEQGYIITIPLVGNLFPMDHFGIKILAMFFVVAFTAINHRSVSTSGNIQVLFTILKIAALLFLICGIFFSGKGNVTHFTADDPSFNFTSVTILTGFIAATSGALAAYDGWNNLGFIAGEIRDPKKNIPYGIIGGLAICIILYILTTQAYLYMMPVSEMKNSQLVATDTLSKVMGPAGVSVIAAMVIISSAGAANGNILPCARITYAMSKDNMFFKWGGAVDKKYHTPYGALWIQCIVACLFILTGSFDMLADLFVFISWLFYGFGAYGIFILRKKMPDTERPFRLKGYPWIPVVFIFFSVFYFFITIYNDVHRYHTGESKTINSALGCVLLMIGIPFYFYFKKKSRFTGT